MSTLAVELDPQRRHAFGLLVGTEIKLALRRPVGLVVALGIPFALLVIFGSIPATTRPTAALGGISFFTLYVPTLLVFVLIAVGLGTLPQTLATYRQQGVLRRMSTTPVPPSWLLAAQMTINVILAAMSITIIIGLGALAYGLGLPTTVGGWLVTLLSLVLTVVATLGLGLCAAALASSPQVAGAIQALLFYPLAFLSGLYVPLQEIHSTALNDIAKVVPTGAGFNALHASFLGHSPGVEPLLVLAGWAIMTSVAAARMFRWE
ncbi:MAG TPA: ABC transporter permease [Solirubrobacteraceae bacterium]|nr:ABC transporter permease [Solirubrobacteraceae bacterium]